jgi:hypothetical protein
MTLLDRLPADLELPGPTARQIHRTHRDLRGQTEGVGGCRTMRGNDLAFGARNRLHHVLDRRRPLAEARLHGPHIEPPSGPHQLPRLTSRERALSTAARVPRCSSSLADTEAPSGSFAACSRICSVSLCIDASLCQKYITIQGPVERWRFVERNIPRTQQDAWPGKHPASPSPCQRLWYSADMTRSEAIAIIEKALPTADDARLAAAAEILQEPAGESVLPRPLTMRELALIEQSKQDFAEGRSTSGEESRAYVEAALAARRGART